MILKLSQAIAYRYTHGMIIVVVSFPPCFLRIQSPYLLVFHSICELCLLIQRSYNEVVGGGREGYLLLTWAWKITCWCFDWMLHSWSGRKWRSANKCCYALLKIHVIGGQRLVRVALPSLPPHHSGPATWDFSGWFYVTTGSMLITSICQRVDAKYVSAYFEWYISFVTNHTIRCSFQINAVCIVNNDVLIESFVCTFVAQLCHSLEGFFHKQSGFCWSMCSKGIFKGLNGACVHAYFPGKKFYSIASVFFSEASIIHFRMVFVTQFWYSNEKGFWSSVI